MSIRKQPLVSVIVPVYNSERYLRYCVDSILQQSHRHLEIILVDDGSTDSSACICDEYAAKDARVTVIHQNNSGIGAAQNAGLDSVHGEYTAFADNDDILDRHNIEFLLQAIEKTGADMSKARWRQFGPSNINYIVASAMIGSARPEHISVFKNPLHTYQTIFCKSTRLIGEALGRNTEALYLNEANWCRLYRSELWDDLRFPENVYAQDTATACKLYARIHSVADIDVALYNWLQRPESVTHKMNSASFYHDHVVASIANFSICKLHHVTPARSYYTLVSNLKYEKKAIPRGIIQQTDLRALKTMKHDSYLTNKTLRELTGYQRFICTALRYMRLFEKSIYDRTIKNMK